LELNSFLRCRLHKFTNTEKLIQLFLVFVMIFTAFFLTKPFPHLINNDNDKVLARLEGFTNNLRVKDHGYLNWKELHSPYNLTRGDLVFTHKNSTAIIKYLKGLKLELGPNTLIEINEYEGKLDINIKTGYIKIFMEQNVKRVRVRSEKQTIEIESTNSNIGVLEVNKFLEISVKEGEARIFKDESSPHIKIESGQTLGRDIESNKTIIKSSSITQEPIYIEGIQRIIGTSKTIKNTSIPMVSKKIKRPILVKPKDALPLIRPPRIPKVTNLKSISDKTDVFNFSWERVPGAVGYLIEFYKDKETLYATDRIKTKTNNYLWIADFVDETYYRLRSINREGNAGEWSIVGELIAPISPFTSKFKK